MDHSVARRLRAVIIMVVFLVGASAIAFAEYDQEHVVQVMRNNGALVGAIRGAAEAEDWFLAAQKLYELADGMLAILPYTPPRGDKEEWDATMTEFIRTAFIGIGAAGAMDGDALGAAVGRLFELNRQGHGDHK
jgi:hypothetical protein